MNRDWARLAQAISAARRDRGWTQTELAKAAGVRRSTIQNLEGGYEYKQVPASRAEIERALEWPAGSVERILEGGPLPTRTVAPKTAEQVAPPRSPFAAGIPLRVREELASGDVVDTVVMDLSDDSRGIKLVAILKAEDAEGVDPDEMRETLHRWAQAQRKLHGLPTSDSPD